MRVGSRERDHQPQWRHQTAVGEGLERRDLVAVELDPLRRATQQHGDDTVAAGTRAPDETAVAVDGDGLGRIAHAGTSVGRAGYGCPGMTGLIVRSLRSLMPE